MAEKGKISGFKNNTSIVLQEYQNKVHLQRKGLGIALRFSLHVLKGRESVMKRQNCQPFKRFTKNLDTTLNPFYENLLYFGIAVEHQNCCFKATTYFAFSLHVGCWDGQFIKFAVLLKFRFKLELSRESR